LSLYEDNLDLFEEQFATIEGDYPQLHYREMNGVLVLEGKLCFDLTCTEAGERIKDSYLIQLQFPEDYPARPPEAREVGSKIASNFHKSRDKTLCLDIPSRVYMIFMENPTVRHFIRVLLEPYLYAHSYWRKYNGKMPFGDRAHYGDGIVDYYSEYFCVENKEAVIDLLELVVQRNYKQSAMCPCGSRKKIKKCHGKIILDIYNRIPVEIIKYEIDQIRMLRYGVR
jgi:hypothetical protein